MKGLGCMTDQLGEAVAVIQERLNAVIRQIDDNARMTEGVHRLAGNVEALTTQVKNLAEQHEATTEKMEGRLKEQGMRIGALELKPAHRWDATAEKVAMGVIAAIVAFILARIGL